MNRTDGRIIVDIGKSGTRLRVHPSRRTLHGPGALPEVAARPDAAEHLANLVLQPYRDADLPEVGIIGEVVVGTTLVPPPEQMNRCQSRLAAQWPEAIITIVDDGVLAHAAALGAAGTVISIGTGTVAVARDSSGSLFTADGWGPDLGDRGSAYSIGHQALRLACSTLDGVDDAHTLLSMVQAWLGVPLSSAVASTLLDSPHRVEQVSGLATTVCRAGQAGDRASQEIVRSASRDIAATAAIMSRAVDNEDVVVVGGLLRSHFFHDSVTRAIHDHGLRLRPPRLDILNLEAGMIASRYGKPPHRITTTSPPEALLSNSYLLASADGYRSAPDSVSP